MSIIHTSAAALKNLLFSPFSVRATPKLRCSGCAESSMYRIRRTFLMRMVGVREHYVCSSCRRHSVRWLGRFWSS
jgi:hypothetical protein